MGSWFASDRISPEQHSSSNFIRFDSNRSYNIQIRPTLVHGAAIATAVAAGVSSIGVVARDLGLAAREAEDALQQAVQRMAERADRAREAAILYGMNPDAIHQSEDGGISVDGNIVTHEYDPTSFSPMPDPFNGRSVNIEEEQLRAIGRLAGEVLVRRPGIDQRFTPNWELKFWEDRPRDYYADTNGYLAGLVREYVVKEEEITPMTVAELKLKDLAPLLPEGTLGMHLQAGKPFNLIFKPESPEHPDLSFIERQGWFKVHKHEDTWWSPATLESYNWLLESGLEVKQSKKVSEWVTDRVETVPLQFGEDCPLFDYQKDAVSFLACRDRAMLSLSPGLGKTLTSAYAAAKQTEVKHILLVCPASLLYYWKTELEKWSEYLPKKPIPVVWHKDSIGFTQVPDECEQLWVITNPETLVRKEEWFNPRKSGITFHMMIVDESIMYKHRDSQRAQVVCDLGSAIPKVWLLTGAPATRYLDDMWHQLHILDQRGYSSYWRFANNYCIVEETQWAKTVVANRKGAEALLKENIQDIYFARSQEQVADIPPWLFDDIDIPMTEKQQEVYDKLRKDLLIHLEGVPDAAPLKVRSHIALMLRTLQVLSNPVLVGSANTSGKWGAIDELMNMYPGPYILWVNFIRTGELLLEAMLKRFEKGKGAVLVNGSTPMEDRNTAVQRIQNGELDVIILNNTVGKFGFNLTKAPTAIFVERMYDDSYFQCLYRNRRIGTTTSPNILNLRSVTTKGKRTLDHAVHTALDYRTGMIKALTVGDIREALEE